MRCVTVKRFGDPAQVLELGDIPMPEPGPGQARMRLLHSPIHNHDLSTIRGLYGVKPALPFIPGTEALGIVDALGSDVDQVVVGQRVVAAGVTGAWADRFVAKAAALVPLPASVVDEVACQLVAMPLSACILIEDLQLKPGEWMIQNAAAGAVGKVVNVLARERGIKVINLVRRKESLAGLDAEYALSTDDPHWGARVAELTAGAPLLRAVDSVGGRAGNDLMNVLGFGGLLVSFGALSGEPLVIDPGNLIFKQASIRGFWAVKRRQEISPADTRRMLGDVIRLAASGRLPLKVDASFDLARAAEAAVASERSGRTGKITIRGQ
jgi:NADPH:quinone reductase-like Zn-dependent oxidoreductase